MDLEKYVTENDPDLLRLSQPEFVADLKKRVTHQPPSHGGIIAKHEEIRAEIFRLGLHIGLLVPKGREQSLALTKLEEVMFWSNAGIARNQE